MRQQKLRMNASGSSMKCRTRRNFLSLIRPSLRAVSNSSGLMTTSVVSGQPVRKGFCCRPDRDHDRQRIGDLRAQDRRGGNPRARM